VTTSNDGSGFGLAVTVSATYGAGGSVVAPRLAQELGLPFIDRLISADLAESANSQEGLCEGEQASTPAGRFLSYFARAASVGAVLPPDATFDDDENIRDRTEAGLLKVAQGAPAVVLGRAGAVVLASRRRAFHVRLDGPVARRVAWATTHEGLDAESGRRRQAETDRARTLFVKRLYRIDPGDPKLYHLMVDPTVIGIDATVALIADAARAFVDYVPA
jgi:cytidylate kinase